MPSWYLVPELVSRCMLLGVQLGHRARHLRLTTAQQPAHDSNLAF